MECWKNEYNIYMRAVALVHFNLSVGVKKRNKTDFIYMVSKSNAAFSLYMALALIADLYSSVCRITALT